MAILGMNSEGFYKKINFKKPYTEKWKAEGFVRW